MGSLAHLRGDLAEAERLHHQALTIFEESDDQVGVAICYSEIGNLAEERGRIVGATVWHQKAVLIRPYVGVPEAEDNIQRLQRYRAALGPEAFDHIAAVTVGVADLTVQIIELLDESRK